MAKWTAYSEDNAAFIYDTPALKKAWAKLHAGDAEPWPESAAVQQAWAHFHAGEFKKAFDAGIKAGGDGLTVANKAQCIYATYLETDEKTRLAFFLEAAERAEAQQSEDPENANAWYWQAYALGRYSQGISVAKALSQGLGGKIKSALEEAISLAPKHADAHIALGAFHAEVISKVGSLLARTQGASKDAGLAAYEAALKLNPRSAIAMIEYADGLVMLKGEKALPEAEALYLKATQQKALDAMEQLDIQRALDEMEDE